MYDNLNHKIDFNKLIEDIKIDVLNNDITKAYGLWFDSLVRRYVYANRLDDMKYREFLENCVFFNTVTYDRKAIASRKTELGLSTSDTSVEMDDFHLIYNWVNENLYGKRWISHNLRFHIPMAIVCLDYEGTRYAKKLEEPGKNAHLHVIWVVHPDKVDQFREILYGPEFRLRICDKLSIDKFQLRKRCSQATALSGSGA